MFPLGTVIFPGLVVPLHIFEDRYRALVREMIAIEDPAERVFGVTAIREGYEVGDHGAQSLHRIGTLVQLTEVEAYDDGRFDIEIVGRQRLIVDEMEPAGEYPAGEVTLLDEEIDDLAAEEGLRTTGVFERYRELLGSLRGGPVLAGDMPQDPVHLGWTLAGTCLLTLDQRQDLLAAEPVSERLAMIRHQLSEEIRAMKAVPSLPATEVARTRWSPN